MTHQNPTHEALQGLVGRALIDPAFRKDLLNGHRAECLAECSLTSDEQRAASTIQASDLTSFARQLDEWITDRVRHERHVAAVAAVRPVQLAAVA
jgi:hypothetical protein